MSSDDISDGSANNAATLPRGRPMAECSHAHNDVSRRSYSTRHSRAPPAVPVARADGTGRPVARLEVASLAHPGTGC
eukprot:308553-Pyramimonas_sp.AAC.1